MTTREALEAVVRECPDGYAKTYASAALNLGGSEEADVVTEGCTVRVIPKKTGRMMDGEELRVQILYVLSNTTYWRGQRAREVKEALKSFTKEAL